MDPERKGDVDLAHLKEELERLLYKGITDEEAQGVLDRLSKHMIPVLIEEGSDKLDFFQYRQKLIIEPEM